jgi:mono/diheme cytochrome c family protein
MASRALVALIAGIVLVVACGAPDRSTPPSTGATTPPDPIEAALVAGLELHDAICAACHGEDGRGPIGDALADGAVVANFSSCEEHIAFVGLGSDGWPDSVYGDLDKQIGKDGDLMPGYRLTMTDEEIRNVTFYQRVIFGGESRADAAAACGVSPPGG